MTKPKYVPGDKAAEGIRPEELVRLRAKARAYLKDPRLKKLAKDLREDVVTVMLLDRTLGTETWRVTDRVAADSRGRFTKMAEAVIKDAEGAGDEDELDDIIGGEE